MNKAIVLLSGGLDSATALYMAKKAGYKCLCFIFDYGQRHRKEIIQAKRLAQAAGCAYKILKIKLPWKGSSLLDERLEVARAQGTRAQDASEIPDTYVPGRNIIFLSFALSFAESVGAGAVYIGAHAQDYSGYPDCRPEFFKAYEKMAACGTRAGVEKKAIKIKAPLLNKTKAQIIRIGNKLGIPFGLTWSCYKGGRNPCGKCDSCYFRAKGFSEAGIKDPLTGK